MINHSQFIKNLAIIEKHLVKNEHYFRRPEQKVVPYVDQLEREMRAFADAFRLWEE